jgi:hypothetical protein
MKPVLHILAVLSLFFGLVQLNTAQEKKNKALPAPSDTVKTQVPKPKTVPPKPRTSDTDKARNIDSTKIDTDLPLLRQKDDPSER